MKTGTALLLSLALLPAGEPLASSAEPTTHTNSLGMKFAAVGGVEFCIWETRIQDFEVFARETSLPKEAWPAPKFDQGPEHPVVNVTWLEAIGFCNWLTQKEHREGALPADKVYRLPTDLEWSQAAGLKNERGETPEQRDLGVPGVYPWGEQWPPPKGAGNFTGEEANSDVAIRGYNDGFPWTSPVGSFEPNKFGIYDLAGNVWEWVMDEWTPGSPAKVLRGSSWYNGALKLSLMSSCRVHAAISSAVDNYGFRCVIADAPAR